MYVTCISTLMLSCTQKHVSIKGIDIAGTIGTYQTIFDIGHFLGKSKMTPTCEKIVVREQSPLDGLIYFHHVYCHNGASLRVYLVFMTI